MTNTFKRRIYRLVLASATCFLLGLLAYDGSDLGIASTQLDWVCYLFVFMSIVMFFKALDTWSSWEEDQSEDTDEDEQKRSNPYPITFYVESIVITLIAVFLLIWSMIRNQPTAQETIVFIWSLFIAGACMLTGRLSSYLRE